MEKAGMKISVAMTTYNGEKYLEEQMESIRTQIRAPDEVIIVDDCSADNTAEVVLGYIDRHGLKHWKLRSRTENQGWVRNFREALSLTTGDIIFLSDQDDVWFSDKIEIMAGEIENNKNIRLLASDYTKVPEKGKEKKGKVHKRARYLSSFGLYGCTHAITRPLCDEYLALPVYVVYHDLALTNLAVLKGGLYFINKPLIYHRIHSSNVSRETRNDLTKRLKGAEYELEMYPDLQLIADNCENASEKIQVKAKKQISITIWQNTKRLEFLKKRTFGSFIKYALSWLRHPFGNTTFKRIGLDAYLVIKHKRNSR
jgi:glycosyltransferase involved in cell wall biosynthesis